MTKRWNRFALLMAMGVLSLALLACSDDSGDETEGDTETTATTTATATGTGEATGTTEATATGTATGEATGTTEATATETGEGEATEISATLSEFAIELESDTAPAGEVTFNAENTGALPHELVVIKSDEAPDSLPVEGATVDESAVEVVGRIPEFPAGETASDTFTLEAGEYVLICNIAGHYAGGMFTGFTVE